MASVRPALIACDTDALFQLFLAKRVDLLDLLRREYGVVSVIQPDVEIELQSNPRLSPLIAKDFKKALAANLLQLFDANSLLPSVGNPAAASALISQIKQRGLSYQRFVDIGEAHTLAAAVELGCPAMSHDRSALDTLIKASKPVPATVLRFFDLLVFGQPPASVRDRDGIVAEETATLRAVSFSARFNIGIAI